MRKKGAMLLAAVLAAALIGCAAEPTAASSGAASSKAASSEAELETEVVLSSVEAVALANGKTPESAAPEKTLLEDAEIIEPLEEFKIVYPMDDGVYAASFEADDVSDTRLTATLYAYDRYEVDSIGELSEGDVLRTHTGDGYKTADIVVEKLENDGGCITINGGIDEGGIELKLVVADDSELYRTVTMDDYPIYYMVGDIALTVNKKAMLSDASADFGADPVLTEGRGAVLEAIAADETGWYAHNTTIEIANGRIKRIDRIWVP